MDAGRELDAKIHEHIFSAPVVWRWWDGSYDVISTFAERPPGEDGWLFVREPCYYKPFDVVVLPKFERFAYQLVPCYPTDWAAAALVIEAMAAKGYEFALICDGRSGPLYAAEFATDSSNIGETTYLHGQRSNEAPHAICLAALAALGVEV